MATNGNSVGDVPENANQECPGTASESAGKAAACEGCPNQSICAATPQNKGPDPDLQAISDRMRSIKHKILVLSGKGGVGKSTFSSQLAFILANQGRDVGLLDIDICGPSLPKMLGLEGEDVHQSGAGWSPVYVDDNLGVMSIGFLLPNPDDAVVWRGPRKNGVIKQFLKDVHWGEIDYLIVDAPPGTSDEHISVAQYLKATEVDGAVILSTPQEVSIIDVRKEINFCQKTGIPILGVVENMSSLVHAVGALQFLDRSKDVEKDVTQEVLEAVRKVVPDVSSLFVKSDVFCASKGGAEVMAGDMGVRFLGRIPLDPNIGKASENGESVLSRSPGSPGAKALSEIVSKIVSTTETAKN